MWYYSGNPSSSRKDEVRFLIGDTNDDPSEQLLSDEEIIYALKQYPVSSDTADAIDSTRQPLSAALLCAETIWRRFSRQADEQLPPINFEYAARAKNYKTTVDDLRKLAYTRGSIIPFVGGQNVLDKVLQQEDDALVKPEFSKDMTDNHNSITGVQRQNLLDE